MEYRKEKVLLDHWSAIDLFCRIITKFDPKVKMEIFKDNSTIVTYLNKCFEKDYYLSISKSINDFAKKIFRLEEIANKRIYYISKDIDKGCYLNLDEDELKTLEAYIDHPIRRIESNSNWKQLNKQRSLEGTRWYLYYYEDFEMQNEEGEKQLVQTVIRSVIYFKELSQVKQVGQYAKNENDFEYHGSYSTYGENERFLQLYLKKKDESGDARYVFNVDSKNPDFALGQYQNMNEEDGFIFSGFAILDRFGTVKKGSITPKVFKQNSDDWNELPIYVRSYMNTSKCEIATPIGIKNSLELSNLLKDKNRKGMLDHLNKKNFHFYHKEKDIRLFRRKLHMYYSTGSNPKLEPDGKSILFWNHTIFDFSSIEIEGRLVTKVKIFDRQRKNKFPIYDAEMFRLHAGDPLIFVMRRENSNEPITIAIIAPMPVGFDPIEFGCTFHDDWTKSTRLSPTILSLDPLFGTTEEGPLDDQQAQSAQKMWNDGFLNNEKRFTVFQQFNNLKK